MAVDAGLGAYTPQPQGYLGSEPFAYLELEPRKTSTGRPRILWILSRLLDRVVSGNDYGSGNFNRLELNGSARGSYGVGSNSKMTVFHGLKAPAISIEKYLERIFKYANCSPSCFVVAYVYMDRIIHQHPELQITSLNVHRLLVTSTMVAAKFLDDAYFNNAYYAKVGGVTTAEMNRLELEFLFRLDFRLQVTMAAFSSYCAHLEHELMLSEAHRVQQPLIVYSKVGCATPATLSAKDENGLLCEPEAMDTESYEVQTPPREVEVYGRPASSLSSSMESSSPMRQ